MPQPGDTGLVSEDTRVPARARPGQALAFVRSAEPRAVLPRRAVLIDVALAALVVAAAVTAAWFSYSRYSGPSGRLTINGRLYSFGSAAGTAGAIPWRAIAAAVVTTVPLAARRRFPLAAFLVLVLGVLVTSRYATDVTFLAVVFAAASAVAYSRFRNAALLSVPAAGVLVAVAFWNVAPARHSGAVLRLLRPLRPVRPLPPLGPHLPALGAAPAGSWRLAALLVLVSLVSITVFSNAMHARDRMRRLRAEHEAATRRAIELERARIASELHDVVTHNVSVMIVQAGAARQVLADSPDDARAAMLAVESSGRAAMTELRHLLGLLSPSAAADGAAAADDAAGDGALAGQDLRPQPGLGQLQSLIDGVTAAGLPVELHVGDVPPGLPPGLDLAAFRIVQEALTNVLKHVGKPRTSVRLDCRDGDFVVEVADDGRPIPAAGPVIPAVPGAGRGLLGLRERTALYGGEFDAGPRPGGGWIVRARIPVGPLPSGQQPPGHEPAGPEPAGPGGRVPVAADLR